MNADGTGKVNLTNSPSSSDGWPRWSADGTRIFFQSNRAGNFDIWSMDPFGGNLVNLTAGSLLSDNTPEVSPDGRKLASPASSPRATRSPPWTSTAATR